MGPKSVTPPQWLQLVRPLGAGGMGQVFEAIDTRKGEHVALKTLARFEGVELLRLKNEFRTFADVVHPNLVTQHELLEAGGQWFLLMELLHGTDLLKSVRGESVTAKARPSASFDIPPDSSPTVSTGPTPQAMAAAATARTSVIVPPEDTAADLDSLDTRSMAIEIVTFEPPAPARPDIRVATPAPDLQRLRRAMHELALGIDAIHRSGHLHRDIKPTNVIVSTDGRTVLLDFGIAVSVESQRHSLGEGNIIIGTPGYLAPEILRRQRPSPASDWYSFGVVLYELLSGTRPFRGPPMAVFRNKLFKDPVPIEELVLDLPQALASLTNRLLSREPRERPSVDEILETLSETPDERRISQVAAFHKPHTRLVGRHRELDVLRALADEALTAPKAIFLRGRSGVGKSTVIDGLLEALAAQSPTVIAGRCYEHESVPYKAVDKLVDALTTELVTNAHDVEALLPEDASALAQAFPVFRTVLGDKFKARGEDLREVSDLQRRAIDALAELLLRLARRVRLVCCIDDLQWGDTESIRLYARLSRPGGPPLLVLGGFRAEGDASPAIEALRATYLNETGALPEVMDIEPLSQADSSALAEQLAREAGVTDPQIIAWAERESRGEPYFLHELMFFAAVESDFVQRRGVSLKDVLSARIARLSPEARQLLDVVALAGYGLPHQVATGAAQLQNARRAQQELRAGHFVRTSGPFGEDAIDTWHDQVREVVTAKATADVTKRTHASLVAAWRNFDEGHVARVYALAFHAARAGDELAATEAVQANVDAANAAFAAFNTTTARECLLEARAVAARSGLPFDHALCIALGDACLAIGDEEGADRAFRDALERATKPVERAYATYGLSRISIGRLDTAGTLVLCNKALQELGAPPLGNMVASLFDWLSTWLGRKLGRDPTATTDPARDALMARLYYQSGYAGYFLMRRKYIAEAGLRMYKLGQRLPPRQTVNRLAGLGTVFGALGKRKLASRFAAEARAAADVTGDPAVIAMAAWHAGFTADIGGSPREAIDLWSAHLNELGKSLENAELYNMVASYSWNAMMRGFPQLALPVIALGVQRLAQNENLLSRCHSFRLYPGPLLAMIGRDDEGKAHLDQFEALVRKHAPNDLWRNTQLCGQRALYLQLIGADDDAFERCVVAHDALGIKPSDHPLQVRQYYVAVCYRRLAQGERDNSPLHRQRLARACAELRRTGAHPTTQAHLEIALGGLAHLEGKDPLPAWQRARVLAKEFDNIWVEMEADLHEARLRGSKDLLASCRAKALARGFAPIVRRAAD